VAISSGWTFFNLAAERVHSAKHLAPLIAARETDSFRRIQITHVRRIVAHVESRERTRKITGPRAVRIASHPIIWNGDVRRYRRRRSMLVRHDTAEARILQS